MKGRTKYNGSFIRAHETQARVIDLRIPRFLTQYSMQSGTSKKIYLVCNKLVGGTARCDFSIRKDAFLENPTKNAEHKCMAMQIDNYFQREKEDSITINEVTKKLIVFIGHEKLPLSTVEKDSFKEFLLTLIKLGQDNPTSHAEDLLPLMSRTTFTQAFIKYSDELYKERLKQFQQAKGSCIVVDAGKHKTVPYLMIVLVNSLIQAKPLIVKAVRFFKGKTEDYARTIEGALSILFEDGIKIVAIVSDNLKSQVSAVNHTDPKSIQQNTLNPQLSSIIWISCSVHTLALALNDAAKECTYSELIDHIREAAKFLRLKNIVNLLGVKCPLWAPTRWTGMFDIAFWMLKNNSKIISAITASLTLEKAYDFSDFIIDGVTTAASIAFCILLPFYHATHILEADDIPAAYTIPVVESALMHMKEICSRIDVSEEIVKAITKCTERRLKLSQSGRILQLLYSLTPYGRKNLRESGELEISGHDSIKIPVPFTDKPTDAEEAMLNSIF